MSTLKYYDTVSGTWKFLSSGKQGPTGPSGATGATGVQGFTGPLGPTGPAGTSGIIRSIIEVTTSTSIGATEDTDYAVFVNTGGAPTMPTAIGNTNRYTIKNITNTNITVTGFSGQTFDGGTLVLGPDEAVDLVSDNANWRII